jgi:hypothetical protein
LFCKNSLHSNFTVQFIEYSSQYIYGTLLHSDFSSTGFPINYSRYNCLACLLGRCNSMGIMFIAIITLCHDDDCGVVFGSVSKVSKLLNIIIWGYML